MSKKITKPINIAKNSILKNLANQDIFVKVFPYNTSFSEIEKWEPNGYFLSNGPGDPEPLVLVQELAKKIIENYSTVSITTDISFRWSLVSNLPSQFWEEIVSSHK